MSTTYRGAKIVPNGPYFNFIFKGQTYVGKDSIEECKKEIDYLIEAEKTMAKTTNVDTGYAPDYRGFKVTYEKGDYNFVSPTSSFIGVASFAEGQRLVDDFLSQTPKPTPSAVRSGDADGVAYHLISPIGLARLAATYREGSDKYGDYNWTKGLSIGECLNHALRHIFYYLLGDRSEDHLAHAAWNLFTVMHFEYTDRQLTLHKYDPNTAKEIMDGIFAPKGTNKT